MKPTLNKRGADIELDELLEMTKRELLLKMNCHHIATVQTFDAAKRTVSATVNYCKTYYKTEDSGKRVPYSVEYPILLDCPVIILGGGTASLTFPIKKGDECLMLFNDRDIDNWVAGAKSGPVATNRLHSFSDGIALIGFIKPGGPAYDEQRALLQNKNAMVGVGEDKIKIANNLHTLNGLLQELCTALQALTVTCAAPGSPSTAPLNAAAIGLIATKLGALLE